MSNVIQYDRKRRVYSDGRYLYMSATGIRKNLFSGWACVALLDRLGGPDLVVSHWGGFAGASEVRLYRRSRIRWWSPEIELLNVEQRDDKDGIAA